MEGHLTQFLSRIVNRLYGFFPRGNECVTVCFFAKDLVKHHVSFPRPYYSDHIPHFFIKTPLEMIMKLYIAAIVVMALAATAIIDACMSRTPSEQSTVVNLFLLR